MKKKCVAGVCMLVLGLVLLGGCGKKKETMADILSSIGLQTFPEMVGEDIPCIETFEDGTASADYFPDEEELDGLLTQYEEYLTQECGEPEYSGTWTKDNVTINVMSDAVYNQDYDFTKEGARAILVSVYRSE